MRKINKIVNIALIFTLGGIFLCQDGYALRVPMNGCKKVENPLVSLKKTNLLFEETILCDFDNIPLPETFPRFRIIETYFDQVDNGGVQDFYKRTDAGDYIPSSLVLVYFGLSYLIRERIVDDSLLFCDAGCGDGRIVKLMAEVFGIDSLGVEDDKEVLGWAQRNIKYKSEGTLGEGKKMLAQGNFARDNTYKNIGLNFKDIRIFFNFINNQKALAKKITEEPESDPVLLIYDTTEEPEEFPGLYLIGRLKIIDPSPKWLQLDYVYINVYTKKKGLLKLIRTHRNDV